MANDELKPNAPPASLDPVGSAVDAARAKLISAACLYAAGKQVQRKCPDMDQSVYFRETIDLALGCLAAAAEKYFDAVCAPNDRTERPEASHA